MYIRKKKSRSIYSYLHFKNKASKKQKNVKDVFLPTGERIIGKKDDKITAGDDDIIFSDFNSDLDDVADGETHKKVKTDDLTDNRIDLDKLQDGESKHLFVGSQGLLSTKSAEDIIHIGSTEPDDLIPGVLWKDQTGYGKLKRYSRSKVWADMASLGARLGTDVYNEAGTAILGEADVKNSEITTADLDEKVDDTSISGTLSQNKITDLPEDLLAKVNKTTTVNGQALSDNVSLDADDIDDSSTTNKFATATQLSQISTNQSNIDSIEGDVLINNDKILANESEISDLSSLSEKDLSNLCPNPFFTDENGEGWNNLDLTIGSGDSEITDSFVLYDNTIYTASAISSSGTTRIITCSGFPFSASDLDPDRYDTYIKMKGDPTSGLASMIFKILSTDSGSNQITIETYSSSTSFANTEKFELGFYSERSDKCLRTSYLGNATSNFVETDPIEVKNDDQYFSISFDWLMKGFSTDKQARAYLVYKDKLGRVIDQDQIFNEMGDPSYYRYQTKETTVTFNQLTEIGASGEDGAIIADTIFMCFRVDSLDITSFGDFYITGIQINYGNANYVNPRNSAYVAGKTETNINRILGNSSGVDNVKDGKKPDGKYVRPYKMYAPVIIKIDEEVDSGESSYSITQSEIESAINALSNIDDLGTNDKVVSCVIEIEKDNGSGEYLLVEKDKDVTKNYDESTYTEDVLDSIDVDWGTGLATRTVFRNTICCWIKTVTAT